jgi:hypothetical protein
VYIGNRDPDPVEFLNAIRSGYMTNEDAVNWWCTDQLFTYDVSWREDASIVGLCATANGIVSFLGMRVLLATTGSVSCVTLDVAQSFDVVFEYILLAS